MKYNKVERQIARKIHDIQRMQRYTFNRWYDLDLKKGIMIKMLKGKYVRKRGSVLGNEARV